MYKIYADNTVIYDDTSSDPYLKVASPHLTMEDNAAGSLKMTIPPGNIGYDLIVRMATDISVEKDGDVIWAGRALQESKDFRNQRQFVCEGELAFFNDTTQPPAEYSYDSGYAIQQYIGKLLENHNKNVPANRRFTLGAVTVTGSISVTTNYEKTIECFNKLIDEFGGHLRIRRTNGVRYLDYLDTEVRTNTQVIEFGKNLIDFTKSFDSAEFATVIIPLGAKQEEKEIEGVDNYLTVKSVNDGSIYVQAAQEVIENYGWIEKVVHWDDINDPAYLLNRAQMYLSDIQFDTMVLELSALDLHYLNPDISDVRVGDRICVNSAPHGIDHHFFPVTKLDIPLDQPQNTVFQLGDNVKTSLTAANNKTNKELLEAIEQGVNEDAILEAAKANAAAIMALKTNGFITITTDDDGTNEMFISEIRPIKREDGTFAAQRFWRFNMNGLGYTDDGGQSWKAAMLMDGSILGERIAAGSIHGSKITAGTLALTKSSGEEALMIGLTARGMAPDSFEIGNIDQNDGSNIDSTTYARSRYKIYLRAGTTVKLTNNAYYFEPVEYSDNANAESGFVRMYGTPTDRAFTVPNTNYYRFAVYKTSGGIVSSSELNTIASAFDLGGTSAVIRAEDLQIIGMVTFTDLSTSGSTVINGANIITGTVTANKIDLYSGLTVYKNGDSTSDKTFEINSNGEVYINGTVIMGSGSSISWSQVTDKPSDLVYEDDLADVATSGDYTDLINKPRDVPDYIQSTYIDATEIRSPTIKANVFTAIASNYASQTGQSGFRLQRDYNNTLYDAFSIYYFYNQGWEAHLAAENQIVFDSLARFDSVVELNGTTRLYGNNVFYGNIDLSGGGQIVLNWSYQSYGTAARRPSDPTTGQIYFQTD